MSWLTDLFAPKKVTQEPDKTPGQLATGNALTDFAQQYLSQYKPGQDYSGKMTAPMSGNEQAGQDWLTQYMKDPALGENYRLAADEVKKTLTGAYDPYSSEYYKAMRTGAMTEQGDAIDAAKRGQGVRGSFFQSTGLTEERKLREGTTNYLQQMLGKMAENERGNRLGAVDKAMNLEQYAQGAPLAKAQAGTTLGALPRLIEQADLESRYKDFLRKQEELGGVTSTAQQAFGTNINYGVKNYEAPSAFERIMGTVAPIAGQVLGNMAFPGAGAAASAASSAAPTLIGAMGKQGFGYGNY